jgi:hypothetical protein
LSDSSNNALDVLSKWVLQTEGAKVGELKTPIVEGFFEFNSRTLVVDIPVFNVHVEICESDNTEWLLSHMVDFFPDFLDPILSKLMNTIWTLYACTHLKNGFWRTFHIYSDNAWL